MLRLASEIIDIASPTTVWVGDARVSGRQQMKRLADFIPTFWCGDIIILGLLIR